MRTRWGLAVIVALIPAWTGALERSAADLPQAAVVDQSKSALKPQYLFNMRGRRDPFVNSARWASVGSGGFNITLLQFKGVIATEGSTTALFLSSADRALYTLRGSRLYGANDKPVPGVTGRLVSDAEARLRQGELVLNFSASRAVKRKL